MLKENNKDNEEMKNNPNEEEGKYDDKWDVEDNDEDEDEENRAKKEKKYRPGNNKK